MLSRSDSERQQNLMIHDQYPLPVYFSQPVHSTHGNHFNPPRDIPEQLAAYSTQALSTALLMLGAHFAAG